jgi:hypothetical protein
MSLQHASKSLRGTLQFPRHFLDRVLNEFFAHELDLRLSPATMFDLPFEAVLDDETPTCFPRPSGITLQPHYELFELVPRENLGLLGQSSCLSTPLLGMLGRMTKLCHIPSSEEPPAKAKMLCP